MRLSFEETMAGYLTDRQGDEHSAAFDLSVEAADLETLRENGEAAIHGWITAPPWVSNVPVSGTMKLGVWPQPIIGYDLHFDTDDGQTLFLRGAKHPSWRAPIHTMTTLPAELTDGVSTLARGILRFDMDDLIPFMASWRLSDTPGPQACGVDEEVLRATAAAGIVAGGRVPPADEATFQGAVRAVEALPAPHRRGYVLAQRALNTMARVRYGRRFAKLSLARQRRILGRLTRTAAGRLMRVTLLSPIRLAHYDRADFHDALGHTHRPAPAPEPRPRWWRQVMTPDDVAAEPLPCDVVVIGSGAGGGAVAAALAERGHAVAIVEAGAYRTRDHFHGTVGSRIANLWRGGGMHIAMGRGVVAIPTGKGVGGTTTINSGTCLRPEAAVFAEWEAAGLPLSEDALAPYYDAVERELQVTPGDPKWLGPMGRRIPLGLASTALSDALEHGPLPRNAPECDRQGECVIGCPTGAKRSSDVSWIPRALRAGASIFTGFTVERLPLRRGRALVVTARGERTDGSPVTLSLQPRIVVVAAGTLNTPRLLRASGLRHRALGRGLSIHPSMGVFGLYDHSLGRPWEAIPQGYGFHDPHRHPWVRFEGFYAPPAMAAATLDLPDEVLTHWMDAWDRVGQFGLMARDENRGWVRGALRGPPLIRYQLSDRTIGRLASGTATLAEVMLHSGAREVRTSFAGVGPIRTVAQARALRDAPPSASQYRGMGFHPLGTCAMSATDGVTTAEHRVRGTDNIYVVDGSAVPSSLGVNPQVTIMALALRGADAIDAALS